MSVDSLLHISWEGLEKEKIAGILLDLDETLTPHGKADFSEEVIEWIATMRSHFRLCIVSNTRGRDRVEKSADRLGISGIARASKPLPEGLEEALSFLNLPPQKVALIGDRILTDVWGGNGVGLHTILVSPYSKHLSLFRTFLYILEKACLRWSGLAVFMKYASLIYFSIKRYIIGKPTLVWKVAG